MEEATEATNALKSTTVSLRVGKCNSTARRLGAEEDINDAGRMMP